MERYWVLYNAHVDAVRKNRTVNYAGIHHLEIEIPANAKSIPLTNNTNFRGVIISVTNKQRKDFVLFVLHNKVTDISIDKSCFYTLDFQDYQDLNKGNTLLIVHDENPWVKNRIGYNYGATRYDILLLKNGRSVNSPIASYSNKESIPCCSYVKVTSKRKTFKNISFVRNEESTQKTFLLNVKNENKFELCNVNISTPYNEELYADHIIAFENCTNIVIKDVRVDNTYSKINKFGYAFTLYNIWNTKVDNIVANAPWGVFGNNNINKATITNCKINRFDLHCYGCDYFFDNCIISSEIPIGSFMGTMSFKKCIFDRATPCLYRYDYNSYLPFNLKFDRCVINMDNKHHWFLYLSQLSNVENERPELKQKNLPNINIHRCIVNLSEDMSSFDIIYLGKNYYQSPLYGIKDINIDEMIVNGYCEELRIITNHTITDTPVEVNIKGIKFSENCNHRIVVNLVDNNGDEPQLKLN